MKKISQKQLISEEQESLDDVIYRLDNAMLKAEKKLSVAELNKRKARHHKDAYALLVENESVKQSAEREIRSAFRARDELYSDHLIVEADDRDGTDREDFMVGLHTYADGSDVIIVSWKQPICRHYVLDNLADNFEFTHYDERTGETTYTLFRLLLKRKVDLDFDRVTGVNQEFPTVDIEAENAVVGDAFLQELLNRRGDQEFRNIVFSIQRHQGEIIQTPFKQNLIVQGCAGSGKSMIMMHRLPILLYDNRDSLLRNRLYIISPSETYIQMAKKMRIELEIQDLEMGTLQSYYKALIKRFRHSPEEYGVSGAYLPLNTEQTAYIYSEKCIQDIHARMSQLIAEQLPDSEAGCQLFGIRPFSTDGKLPNAAIMDIQRVTQAILNGNRNALKEYIAAFRSLVKSTEQLYSFLSGRRGSVSRVVTRRITQKNREIEKLRKGIENLNKDLERSEKTGGINNNASGTVGIMNKQMDDAIAELRELQSWKDAIEEDPYLELSEYISAYIDKAISPWRYVKDSYESIDTAKCYQAILAREHLCTELERIVQLLDPVLDPYQTVSGDHRQYIAGVRSDCITLLHVGKEYLPENYINGIQLAYNNYSKMISELPIKTYRTIMENIGFTAYRNRIDTAECSPYLYAQILYCTYGQPSAQGESLIAIDEAQNIAVEELRLIRAINGKKAIFNLYGDVNQHVENSKGIDDWNDFSSITGFHIKVMSENYRNALEITNYCNRRFHMNMDAINLSGNGVHEISSESALLSDMQSILQRPQNPGTSCIIVKAREEADALIHMLPAYEQRFNNITFEIRELLPTRWNIITVEQAKGLEFETVIALSGRMSDHEKYIAYTRALDELYVYDSAIKIEIMLNETIDSIQTSTAQPETPKSSVRKRREKRTTAEAMAESKNKR